MMVQFRHVCNAVCDTLIHYLLVAQGPKGGMLYIFITAGETFRISRHTPIYEHHNTCMLIIHK